jgi:hypothetical protein
MPNTVKTNNRRQFSRIHFDASVFLRNPAGKWTAKLLDVSLKGALVSRPLHWTASQNDQVFIEIHLPEAPFTLYMECIVAHVHEDKIGLQCTHIDIDSISHLRRLVELNVGDDSILERELGHLGHV